MICADVAPALDRYLDGETDALERDALESHLRGCAGCRASLADLRTLREAAAALPASLRPTRDLWVGIAGRLVSRDTLRRRARWRRAGWMAAAAVLLVAASSGATALLLRRSPPPATQRLVGGAVAIEATYLEAASELSLVLENERGALAPATVETLERNLAVINAAIAESRAALAADPANPALTALLWSAHRRKVALLAQAVRALTQS